MFEIRRYLHEYLELSFQEEKTAQYIADFYKEVPVDSVQTNFRGERGIGVTIKGASPDLGEAYPHHHPKFDINEKSLIISAKAMAAVVASYCGIEDKGLSRKQSQIPLF